jgi:hypothetical protein
MATGQGNKLTGAVGESLLAAGLCRRGLLATPLAGNVPHYDIIASGQSGGHAAVQVKANLANQNELADRALAWIKEASPGSGQ